MSEFIYPYSVNGYVDCFHGFAVIKNDAMELLTNFP